MLVEVEVVKKYHSSDFRHWERWHGTCLMETLPCSACCIQLRRRNRPEYVLEPMSMPICICLILNDRSASIFCASQLESTTRNLKRIAPRGHTAFLPRFWSHRGMTFMALRYTLRNRHSQTSSTILCTSSLIDRLSSVKVYMASPQSIPLATKQLVLSPGLPLLNSLAMLWSARRT